MSWWPARKKTSTHVWRTSCHWCAKMGVCDQFPSLFPRPIDWAPNHMTDYAFPILSDQRIIRQINKQVSTKDTHINIILTIPPKFDAFPHDELTLNWWLEGSLVPCNSHSNRCSQCHCKWRWKNDRNWLEPDWWLFQPHIGSPGWFLHNRTLSVYPNSDLQYWKGRNFKKWPREIGRAH